MSEHVSRRKILMAGGVGLAGVGLVGAAAEAYRRGTLSARELQRLPRMPEMIRPTDHAALGRNGVLEAPSRPALASRLVEYHIAPGEGLEDLGVDVRQSVAEFVCDPRHPNLLLNKAQRVAYEVVEVAWQPGQGWPVYRSRAPLNDHAVGVRYAGVPRHQIVLLDDRAVYVGNPGAIGVIDGIQGPLRVDVNGEDHAQHRGFYKILITALA